MASEQSKDTFLLKPGPHKPGKNFYLSIGASIAVFALLWFLSLGNYSVEPKAIAPAKIEGEGVSAVVRAVMFDPTTSTLGLQVRLHASKELEDARGMLRRDVVIRVVDDEGVQLQKFAKGDPLTTQEVILLVDGSTNSYPFDKYAASFSILAETTDANGATIPLKLAVGSTHAETGWYTSYKLNQEATDEAKVTIVSMQREAFHITFAVMLAGLMMLLSIMSLVIGILLVTNRRASDPGMVGFLVGLLFALPFTRNLLPGKPPIGCLLDVTVFSWAILLAAISIVLAMVAWMRQSKAALTAE